VQVKYNKVYSYNYTNLFISTTPVSVL